MRRSESRSGPRGPNPAYSPKSTVVATAVMAAAVVGAVVAASYPVATVAAAAMVVASRYGVPSAVRAYRAYARDDADDAVCVPGTEVCVGA